jgi:hypothetical protein
MSKCPYCETQISEKYNFCLNCERQVKCKCCGELLVVGKSRCLVCGEGIVSQESSQAQMNEFSLEEKQTTKSASRRINARFSNEIDKAQKIVININETQIPLVAEVDGFIRIQNTKLDAKDKIMVLLYYKHPEKVSDANLAKWIKYTNPSRLRTKILPELDAEAMLHYDAGSCTLLPKGAMYVEKKISFELPMSN